MMRPSLLSPKSQLFPVVGHAGLVYDNSYIRPLGVSPLDNHERVPKPWGFFFLGLSVQHRTVGDAV